MLVVGVVVGGLSGRSWMIYERLSRMLGGGCGLAGRFHHIDLFELISYLR